MFWHGGVCMSPTRLVSLVVNSAGRMMTRGARCAWRSAFSQLSAPRLQSVQAGQNKRQRVVVVVVVVVNYPHRSPLNGLQRSSACIALHGLYLFCVVCVLFLCLSVCLIFAASGVLWRLNYLTLRMANVNTLPSLGQYAPLIRLRRMALYKSVLIDWLIDISRTLIINYRWPAAIRLVPLWQPAKYV